MASHQKYLTYLLYRIRIANRFFTLFNMTPGIRSLQFEILEPRELLAADNMQENEQHAETAPPSPETNLVANPITTTTRINGFRRIVNETMRARILENGGKFLDTNGDRVLNPNDVLGIINFLNQDGPQNAQTNSRYSPDLDVNSDGINSPLDVLHLINYYNAGTRALVPEPKTLSLSNNGVSTFYEIGELLANCPNVDPNATVFVVDPPLHGTMTTEEQNGNRGMRYVVEDKYVGGDRTILGLKNPNGEMVLRLVVLNTSIDPALSDEFFASA